uniref:Reverse transcriptase domain-containing protein n=1 Tax=Tanacetum cinerariifolium TaxID=118510 RepID=A0A699IQB8_TANCI|nr:reverse transcriptase domain-containing protein [Tanacetum cinerariifolium]
MHPRARCYKSGIGVGLRLVEPRLRPVEPSLRLVEPRWSAHVDLHLNFCTISGTLFLNGRAVFILLDTGTTHSVVLISFAKHISISPTLLNSTLSISTPMKSLVINEHEYQNCPLRFDDKIRFANLLPLEMSDFDISLGMNWLADHRAPIIVSSLVI